VLLVRAGGGVGTLRVAAVLTIAGIFSNKLNLLVAGRAIPFMQPEASYTPSVVEIGGVIGVLGLAALLFVLGKRFLPVSSEA
jgi:Ni/Fe-hydrogenase subunit HybB-like protein